VKKAMGVVTTAPDQADEGLVGAIFEGYPAPTLIVDGDVRVRMAKRVARDLLGYAGDATPLLFRRGGEVLHCLRSEGPGGCGRQKECDDCVIRNAVGRAMASGGVLRDQATLEIRGPDGPRDVRMLVSASSIEHQGQRRVVVTLEDVSDLVRLREEASQVEQALRESEHQLSLVLEGSNDGFWDLDLPGHHYMFSGRCFEIIGEGPVGQTVPARFWWGRLHPDDVHVVRDALDDHLVGRTVRIDAEFRIAGTGGAWRWTRAVGRALERDGGGRPTRLAGTLRDIQERRTAQDGLRVALAENEKLVADLREALGKVKSLTGLLPICAWCKRIRDDQGYWALLEAFLSQHSDATFSHGVCPECFERISGQT
jgi:PAS domain S-box-containing protein